MKTPYQTAGRKKLLAFLMQHPDRQFSADEIHTSIYGGDTQGKSSLYRQLSKLCDEGSVRKFRADNQAAYVYQYVAHHDCCHHFHLKCLSCGELTHLDCAVSDDLLLHIEQEHGFCIDSGRSILYGLCRACEAHTPTKGKGKGKENFS